MTNPTAHGVSVFDGLVDAPSDLSAAIARVRAYIAGESSVILPGDIPAVCAAAERAAAQEPPAQAEPQPEAIPIAPVEVVRQALKELLESISECRMDQVTARFAKASVMARAVVDRYKDAT